MNEKQLRALSYQGLSSFEKKISKQKAKLEIEQKNLLTKDPELSKLLEELRQKRKNLVEADPELIATQKKIDAIPINRFRNLIRLFLITFIYLGIPVTYYLYFPYDLFFWFDIFIALAAIGLFFNTLEFCFGDLMHARKPKIPQELAQELRQHDKRRSKILKKYDDDKSDLLRQQSESKDRKAEIKRLLNKIKAQQDLLPNLKRRAKERERTATIAAFEDEARLGATTIRQDLIRNAPTDWFCPYCGVYGDSNDSHADHIHPISKGGRTVPQNMVLICSNCNRTKSSKTLRVFAREQNLNFEQICDRLEAMGKDI